MLFGTSYSTSFVRHCLFGTVCSTPSAPHHLLHTPICHALWGLSRALFCRAAAAQAQLLNKMPNTSEAHTAAQLLAKTTLPPLSLS
jgi:hypothetical protein